MESQMPIPAQSMTRKTVCLKPWVYAMGIMGAETTVDFINPRLGMAVYLLVFSAVMLSALSNTHLTGSTDNKPEADNGARFYLVLTLVPLMRIIELSLPVENLPISYRYAATGVLMAAAALLAMKESGYQAGDIYLRLTNLPFQGLTVLAVLLLLYFYLSLNYENMRLIFLKLNAFPLALLILVLGSLLEEIIYRGLLLKTTLEHMSGTPAVIYVSALYAAMSAAPYTPRGIVFVILISLLLTYSVKRTGSIAGAALGHSLINILGFGVMP